MTTSLVEPGQFEYKSVDGQLSIDEKQGIVECFVAAIGNKDSVGDIIMPGAFTKGLRTRRPRVVWGHDWNHPIGKVLEIYEVGPMDPRLPMKMKSAGVGGLFARVQFNLRTEKGKEAFENILFFGEDQEWSIGYKTLDAEKDARRQANLLKEVELYEVSPVLHGANQLTATISIKSDLAQMDDVILKGLAMLKTFADQNQELVAELKAATPPGNVQAIQDAVGGATRGHGPRRGGLEDLLDYWRPIMKKPGGFRRCLVILADHPELGPLPNLCAWLHHETTGKWPNEKSADLTSNVVDGEWAEIASTLSKSLESEIIFNDTASTESTVVFGIEVDGEVVEYEAEYTKADDQYMFGPKKKRKGKNGCKCGGDCCGTEKDASAEILEKVGRAISARNVGKLEEALRLLQEVVAAGAVNVEVKNEVVVPNVSGDLRKALEVVSEYHKSDPVREGDGTLLVSVGSEANIKAVHRVLDAFGVHEIVAGEVE